MGAAPGRQPNLSCAGTTIFALIMNMQLSLPTETTADLQLRNQFILGPHLPPEFDGWNRATIGSDLSLAVWSGLDLTQVSAGNRRATAIGFMLDPFNPQWTDEDILIDLIRDDRPREALLEDVSRLSGRWILIVEQGEDIWLVNDALGHRQVFFTDDRHPGGIWCASHPRLIAGMLGLEMDPEAKAFLDHVLELNSENPFNQRDRWFPGVGSPYAGVRHLTPNHVLDFNTQRQTRFFPNRPVVKRSLEEAVEEGSRILEGIMHSIAARFDDLTLMITSGLDSRMVLAAGRDIADRLRYVSIDYPKGIHKGIGIKGDVVIPARLLPKLGLKHEIIHSSGEPSAEFKRMHEPYTVVSTNFHVSNAEAALPYFRRQTVAITGSASIAFTAYKRLPRPANLLIKEMTPELLTRLHSEMDDHPFAVRAFGEWLDGAADIYDYHVLDLFSWEQRTGTWNADWSNGFDLVWKDTVTPLNCRLLYATFMGVEEWQRRKPPGILHKAVIRNLWPETLDLDDSQHQLSRNSLRARLRRTWRDVKISRQLMQ